jgi:hypothetical protein
MAGKRDSEYFKRRLRRDYPSAYSSLLAGHYPSVRAAAIDVGLIKRPTRFDALKREWTGATIAEKKRFLVWVKIDIAKSSGVSPKALPDITDANGVLHADVVDFLKNWTRRRRLRPGRIMMQMGFKNLDTRLAESINAPRPLAEEVVQKLKSWLATERFW